MYRIIALAKRYIIGSYYYFMQARFSGFNKHTQKVG